MERKKQGFAVPIDEWLKDDIKDYLLDYINEESLNKHGLFDDNLIIQLRDSYLDDGKVNFNKIWIILMFQMWYEEWM
jgi:asparagine synthase (glutamine-hydrolysing)